MLTMYLDLSSRVNYVSGFEFACYVSGFEFTCEMGVCL